MKVLFIENSIEGHHVSYLKALVESNQYQSVVITPRYNKDIPAEQIEYTHIDFSKKNFIEYIKWLNFIKKESHRKEYDIVHFLDGDSIMRFFGLGMSRLRAKKVLITFHHHFSGSMRKLSYFFMGRKRFSIVHTTVIKNKLIKNGLQNVYKIEYPSFEYDIEDHQRKGNEYLTLGALGGTRRDKGLDLLLLALEKVKDNYNLIIAGQEYDIKRETIECAKKKLTGNIICDLKFLSNQRFTDYLNQVDIFVLPYRFSFDGASGPLIEAVVREKMIIGPEHGSLGRIIKENHLGLTFKTEDISDLAFKISEALQIDFKYDTIAKRYKESLSVNSFQNNYYKLYSSIMEE